MIRKEITELIDQKICTPLHCSSVLGMGVCESYFQNSKLLVFDLGVAILKDGELTSIPFSSLHRIKSHLSGEMYSEAAKRDDNKMPVFMEFFTDKEVVVIEISIDIYSKVLIALQEMLGGFKLTAK